MLHIFRKYETYVFAIITVVIIISFSFFGTFNTITPNPLHEQTAFTTVNDEKISRGELEEMTQFISTDALDKRLYGGMWGPNFLNDGVIEKDLLNTGIAEQLILAYPELVENDLQQRLEKEKRYTLYMHPTAQFISTEGAWAYFVPEMKSNFSALRRAKSATDPKALSARVGLYLNERTFPAPVLRQVLHYQEKQFTWLSPDPNLDHTDLSLFNYHSVDDWFGSRTIRLFAEFVMNMSRLAEQKGYQVTKEEALADLLQNAASSYHDNKDSPYLGVANLQEYFNEQLMRMGLDQNKATRIWQQVMQFRRLFHDIGNSIIVDPLSFKKYVDYATDTASGELYRLPGEFRFSDYRTMQKFEIYLDAIAKNPHPLSLPTSFVSIEALKGKAPELIQKRYLLKMAQVQKGTLQSKVGLKEMWGWEGDEKNWQQIMKEFAELSIKHGATSKERMEAIDALDETTRSRLDGVARGAIVDSHPEWLTKALEEAEEKEEVIGINAKGGNAIFGLHDRTELMRLLDTVPLKETSKALAQFTGDQKTYYRITVMDRTPKEEIMTFAEANRQGVLDQLLDQQLENFYTTVRNTKKKEFQKADGEWKNFADVKNEVADLYFDKTLCAVKKDFQSVEKNTAPTTSNLCASLRLYSYMRSVESKLQQKKDDASIYLQQSTQNKENKFVDRPPLGDQWKLEKSVYASSRSKASPEINVQDVFALAVGEWTPVHSPANGDLTFFHLESREAQDSSSALAEGVDLAQSLLSSDLQRNYTKEAIALLKAKNAISLAFLDHVPEEEEVDEENEIPNPSPDMLY